MSLRWSAKHWPIIERAKHGLLPERLSVAEITQLLPLGDDFARTLLEECAIYMHRQGSGLPTDEDEAGFPSPPPDAGEGLRFDDAVNTGTLLRRMLDHPNRYEIDPPDCNPYNGHFYLIHRDDLRAYLKRNGLWPLAEDVLLRTWWPEEIDQPPSSDAVPTGTEALKIDTIAVEDHIKKILKALSHTDWLLDAIPYKGRAAIKRALIESHVLTESQFKRAWAEMNRRKLIRVKEKEKFIPHSRR